MRADGDDGMPTLFGHFAVFNEWTEIDSIFEGRFLERFSPGAFTKTFAESRDSIKAIFQHGFDPNVGDKPLGRFEELSEDEIGAYYEVPLLDASYTRDLIPGLEAGLYGASFRFRVVKETLDREPEDSEHNPDGLPERTVQEAQVYEGGPVTFPAYEGATAGLRSLTDELIFERAAADPKRMRELIEFAERLRPSDEDVSSDKALSEADAGAEPHSEQQSRTATPPGEGFSLDQSQDTRWQLP